MLVGLVEVLFFIDLLSGWGKFVYLWRMKDCRSRIMRRVDLCLEVLLGILVAFKLHEHKITGFYRTTNVMLHIASSCLSVRPSVRPHGRTRFPLEEFS
jgi:hypothetical protein